MSMSNSQEVLTSTLGAKKRSRVRIVILLLLSVGTMINYLDRTILGIVAPQLSKEIHIDPAMMGIIFSAFAWTYALAQIPGGMFLDRFGNKLTYALSIFFWSLFTLLQSFTLGLKSLLLLRLGLGVSEAPCFPANSRIVSTWFPQHERARATATYTVGEYRAGRFLAAVIFNSRTSWLENAFFPHRRIRYFIYFSVVAFLS